MYILKRVFAAVLLFGFVLAVGTAGSCDVGAITGQRMGVQLLLAALCMVVGLLGALLTERAESRRKK